MTAATALSYSRVYGANERIQLGLIGRGERGRYDMGNFLTTGTASDGAVRYLGRADRQSQTDSSKVSSLPKCLSQILPKNRSYAQEREY